MLNELDKSHELPKKKVGMQILNKLIQNADDKSSSNKFLPEVIHNKKRVSMSTNGIFNVKTENQKSTLEIGSESNKKRNKNWNNDANNYSHQNNAENDSFKTTEQKEVKKSLFDSNKALNQPVIIKVNKNVVGIKLSRILSSKNTEVVFNKPDNKSGLGEVQKKSKKESKCFLAKCFGF